jgi:hypothetical protein
MVEPIIRGFNAPFDTHKLERLTLRRHTEAFAEELLEFRQTRDPLNTFSARFAKWVDFTFQQEIEQTTKIRSENLGGLMSENQEWRRR